MGSDAHISGDVNVYNEDVYEAIVARVNGNPEGAIPAGIGDLMGLNSALPPFYPWGTQGSSPGGGWRLTIICPYAGSGAMTTGPGGTMPGAYNFPLAWLMDTTSISLSTRYKRVRCIFRAINIWDAPNYQAVLFNHDGSGLPAYN